METITLKPMRIDTASVEGAGFAINATSNMNDTNQSYQPNKYPLEDASLRITLYSIIFILSVTGNLLVIVTLFQNRRMRTVTNVFLLNLAVSDLLLAVFCMPFTLIPTLLKDFIFGQIMCILIRYLQGVSVSVSVFTLVSMSLERYFAICQPLRSRSWQTLSHSYKIILLIWAISLCIMIPIAVFQELVPLGSGTHKCLEEWSNPNLEKLYTLLLDTMLLIVPLILMFLAYLAISRTLWKGIQREMYFNQELKQLHRKSSSLREKYKSADFESRKLILDLSKFKQIGSSDPQLNTSNNNKVKDKKEPIHHKIRQTSSTKSLTAKKRVIRMLFVLVLEFFICWTPIYVLQTWFVFDQRSAVQTISPATMNFMHLLSYVSSCCNPITYCFMNKKFRQGFISVFRCCKIKKTISRKPSDYTHCSPKTGMLISSHGEEKRYIAAFRFSEPTCHTCIANRGETELIYVNGKAL